MRRNEVVIDGRLLKRSALRYTPTGTPVVQLILAHRSMQHEAGLEREASCEIEAVALGEMALKLSTQKLNQPLQVSGFLTRRSHKDSRLVLHVADFRSAGNGQEQNTNSGDS